MTRNHVSTRCPCGQPAVDQLDKVGRCAKCKRLEERYQAGHARMHQEDRSPPDLSEYRVMLPVSVMREFMP